VDEFILGALILGYSLLLFYVLDAVVVAAAMLRQLATASTLWRSPCSDRVLRELGQQQGSTLVEARDLEGYLDVQFAAHKTWETAQLVYLPFVIQFLMLLSRNALFDKWSWPPILIFTFVASGLLALTGSVVLRRAAGAVRTSALAGLDRQLAIARISKTGAGDAAASARQREGILSEIRKRIVDERRGAYARFIQDPALVAILLPTGLFGILTVLFRFLFGVG
jgi:hypothetical protein